MTPANHCVVVDFGGERTARSCAALAGLCRVHGAGIVGVDTAGGGALRSGDAVNSAFEFSGYQRGLERVAERVAGHPGEVRVLFVNGTALTSHVRWAVRYAAARAFGARPREDGLVLSGLRHPIGPPRTAVATKGYFVPTFAFGLRGPAERLSRLELYDRAVVGPEALRARYQEAGGAFSADIRRWLNPTTWWHGWYRSIPGVPCDEATLYRKQMTIFLELALPAWLASQGVDVSLTTPPGPRALLGAIMLADRVWTNAIKLEHRTSARLGGRRERGRPG